MKTEDGRLWVVAGASRSGKTAGTRKRMGSARRAWAWDPEDQWAQLPGWRKVTTRAQLLEALKRKGAQRIAYVAGGNLAAEFDFFCACAMYAGRYVEPLTVVLEELADVTSPAKAPGHYGILLRRGLKRGITIFCISQRWNEADKTAVGNATDFLVFRLSSGDDVAYLSRKTRVPVPRIEALKPLEFVHLDALSGALMEGRLTF